MATLDGPRQKLGRADEHLSVLETEMRQLLDAKDYRVTETTQTTPGQSEDVQPVYELLDVPDLPPKWGLLIGDFSHNAKSALDHLVFQLALLNKRGQRRSLSAGETWPPISTEFPIFADISDRNKRKAMERDIASLMKKHQKPILRMQPYRRGTRAHSQPLWRLHELRNIDTHRVVHAVLPSTVFPARPLHTMKLVPRGDGASDVVVYYDKGVPLHTHGQVITTLGPGDVLETQLTVQGDHAVDVAFDQPGSILDGQSVLPLLHAIRDEVARILDGFASDLA